MKLSLTHKLYLYGREANRHDVVKMVAIIAMTVDHLGTYLFPDQEWMRVVGRVAAPLFFYLIGTVESTTHKLGLLIFGVLLTVMYWFAWDTVYLNILLNFLFIKWIFDRVEFKRMKTPVLSAWFFVLVVFTCGCRWWFEYAGFGLLFAISARLFTLEDERAVKFFIGTLIMYFIVQSIVFKFTFSIYALSGLAIILVIMGGEMMSYKKGPVEMKWSFPVILFSRYSLEIYVIQLVALMTYKILVLNHIVQETGFYTID